MTGFHPSLTDFTTSYDAKTPQLVWSRFVADMETPVSMIVKLMDGERCAFLLESVQGGETRGRYSIIAIDPDLIWRCFGRQAEQSDGSMDAAAFVPCADPALISLKKLIRESRITIPDSLPPMAAGLIGFMGYDMVKQMEVLPDANPDPIGIPDGCFMRARITVVHDSVDGMVTIATPVWQTDGDADAAYKAACARLEAIADRLARPLPPRKKPTAAASPLAFTSTTDATGYAAMVDRAKEYIRAGDIFQVVPSQRFSAPFALPPFSLYRSLRHLNPSPFLFYLHFGDFSLIGSSPEILVRLRHGTVTIRPIAGTRKRGADPAEDQAQQDDLMADAKELAEHLMLLDLGRNDIGRVAEPHSVTVTEQMTVERYSHVMHIVSNVEGRLRADADAVDALIAGFPAGTTSGAPKIRAMEIIDELEPVKRSFYAGCVGYFSGNGSMDTCITLRTGLIKDGMLHVQAGGGVVADSDPQAEYEESCNKAKAVMRAAELAGNFL